MSEDKRREELIAVLDGNIKFGVALIPMVEEEIRMVIDALKASASSSCAASEGWRSMDEPLEYVTKSDDTNIQFVNRVEMPKHARGWKLALPESDPINAAGQVPGQAIGKQGESENAPPAPAAPSTQQPEAPTPRTAEAIAKFQRRTYTGACVCVDAEDMAKLERELAEALHWKEVYFQSNAEARAPRASTAAPTPDPLNGKDSWFWPRIKWVRQICKEARAGDDALREIDAIGTYALQGMVAQASRGDVSRHQWVKACHREESLTRAIHSTPGNTWTFWLMHDNETYKIDFTLPAFVPPFNSALPSTND